MKFYESLNFIPCVVLEGRGGGTLPFILYRLLFCEDFTGLTLFQLGSKSLVYHWGMGEGGGGIQPPCFIHLFVSLEQQNLVHES